jgi:GNAT superfamily N-acetyltransferase
MDLASRTRWLLRRYWADRLGVVPDAFENNEIAVGPAYEGGVQLFRRGERVVIGAPESDIEQLRQRSAELETLDLDSHTVLKWLTDIERVERVIGPTFYGYTDRETFSPVESNARTLTSEDESVYNAFQAAIPDDEWEQGGKGFVAGETVGRFVDDRLVSLAGYEQWDGLIAHISVVTHPEYRSGGHGRAVVSRVTEQALSAGLIPQYRTSDDWPWSVSVAQRLGFERFVTAYLGVSQE